MNTIDKLTEYFKEFPGIGPRQAKRFVFFLLRKNDGYINDLIKTIPELKNSVKICDQCSRYFSKDESDSVSCNICSSRIREKDSLMIIARDVDLESVEKSGTYNGNYFVLGGLIPVLEKNPAQAIKFGKLKDILNKRKEDGLEEIILALSANPDGDNTTEFLKKELESFNLKISVLGRGLSTGTELEYSDKDTIGNALKNRQ
jgi:recombination protein RecR